MSGEALSPLRSFLTVSIILTAWIASYSDTHAQTPTLRFTLRDSSEVTGQLVASESPGRFATLLPVFGEPLELSTEDLVEARQVGNDLGIARITSDAADPSLFAFSLNDQSQHVGRILSWQQGRVEVMAESYGTVAFDSGALIKLASASAMGKQILSLPNSMHRYHPSNQWKRIDGGLACDRPGGKIAANLELPNRFWIRLSVRCDGVADFALSLGDRTENGAGQGGRVDRRGGSLSRLPTERFVTQVEWFDRSVAFVRSNPSLSNSVVVDRNTGDSLQQRKTLEMDLFIDQVAGRMVGRIDGRIVADVTLPDSDPVLRRSLTLTNDGDPCVVTRLDLMEWDGTMPSSRSLPQRYTLLRDGRLLPSVPLAFQSGRFRFPSDFIDATELIESRFDVPSRFDPQCELILANGSRIRGRLAGREVPSYQELPAVQQSSGAVVVIDAYGNRLAVPADQVRRFVGRCSAEDYHSALDSVSPSAPHVLVAEGVSLRGQLTAASSADVGFGWKATVSRESLAIRSQQDVNILLATTSRERLANSILQLRNGDRLPCENIAMETGFVAATSPWCGTIRVPQREVSRIVLDRSGPAFGATEIEPADRNILLSLPRRQQEAPPTHLVLSRRGDVVRGRVISVDENVVRMSVRDATRLIGREQVAEIVWLDQSQPDVVETRFFIQGGASARLSLTEAKLVESTVIAQHPTFGNCRLPLDELTRLQFGQVNQSVDPWTLQPVKQPRSDFGE